ncbi:transmembrane protease serine 11D-like [Tachyglossus aculeatus]|uniref:transmembrane protease serine 11D-like n=1 Tax=Tachyglossus aculeatus TaxID=9261 RepID=UPI0018F30BA7|nr:transmembrane protease serine 11D-like [Tachyglossus aculeatus]
MYRPGWVSQPPRSLNPWTVALLVGVTVIILAVVIGLLVYFLAFGQRLFYYQGTIQITNVQYTPQLQVPTSPQYRDLCKNIENMIEDIFNRSELRNQFIMSHVARFRPSSRGVDADVMMKFRFRSNNNRASIRSTVERILVDRLGTSGTLQINPLSTEITPLTNEEIENIFIRACGMRSNPMTSSGDRVMGGSLAQEGSWPWQASLQLRNVHHCGAVLISNTWLLTAAHCFRENSDPRQWSVTFGNSIRPPGRRIGVQRILIHRNYRYPRHDFDIAAVQLSSGVTFTRNIHRVCLPGSSPQYPPRTMAYVTGWGSTMPGGPTQPRLRQAEVEVISNDVCNSTSAYDGAITEGMLCAGYPRGGVDACQGDSGGPLVTGDSRQIWTLIGLVSWGYECGVPDKPGVYTRVTAYRDWIREQTGV